jgi:hypothetical protein
MIDPSIMSTIDLIATIIGIIFVVIGLRQTRRSLNASTYQHILNQEANNWQSVRQSSKAVRVQALKNFGIEITESSYKDEHDVLIDHIAVFNFYEGIYFQKRQGVLNKEVWQNWERSLMSTMRVPEFRKNWLKIGSVYSPGFIDFVNKIIDSSAEITRGANNKSRPKKTQKQKAG